MEIKARAYEERVRGAHRSLIWLPTSSTPSGWLNIVMTGFNWKGPKGDASSPLIVCKKCEERKVVLSYARYGGLRKDGVTGFLKQVDTCLDCSPPKVFSVPGLPRNDKKGRPDLFLKLKMDTFRDDRGEPLMFWMRFRAKTKGLQKKIRAGWVSTDLVEFRKMEPLQEMPVLTIRMQPGPYRPTKAQLLADKAKGKLTPAAEEMER